MLCPFLLHMKMNQLYVSMCPLHSGLPFHSGHHRPLSQVPICFLFYVHTCMLSYLSNSL